MSEMSKYRYSRNDFKYSC